MNFFKSKSLSESKVEELVEHVNLKKLTDSSIYLVNSNLKQILYTLEQSSKEKKQNY